MGDLLGPPGSCCSSGADSWPELAPVEVERRWDSGAIVEVASQGRDERDEGKGRARMTP